MLVEGVNDFLDVQPYPMMQIISIAWTNAKIIAINQLVSITSWKILFVIFIFFFSLFNFQLNFITTDPECHQPPIFPNCFFPMIRFYYDEKERKCRSFIGCQPGHNGQVNNYATLEDCSTRCGIILPSMTAKIMHETDLLYRAGSNTAGFPQNFPVNPYLDNGMFESSGEDFEQELDN